MYILYRVYNFPIDFYNSLFFAITTCFFPLRFTKRVIVGLIRASISTDIGRITLRRNVQKLIVILLIVIFSYVRYFFSVRRVESLTSLVALFSLFDSMYCRP